jgi:serine/threonine-protein kinase
MLTGSRAYGGDAVTDILASVIRDEPVWSALPEATPARVRALIERCEMKDLRRRLQAIGEARITLDDVIAASRREIAVDRIERRASRWTRVLPWSLAALLAVAAGLAWLPRNQSARPEQAIRLAFEVSPAGVGASFARAGRRVVARRLDGRVSRAGTSHRRNRRFSSSIQSDRCRPLAGTDDADEIFFSRDGQWIGFSSDRKLKKVPSWAETSSRWPTRRCFAEAIGPTTATLCSRPRVVAGSFESRRNGGQPQPLTTLDKTAGEITHRNPQVLPGSGAVLYTAHTNSVTFDDATIMVQPLTGGAPKRILRGGYAARMCPAVISRTSTRTRCLSCRSIYNGSRRRALRRV